VSLTLVPAERFKGLADDSQLPPGVHMKGRDRHTANDRPGEERSRVDRDTAAPARRPPLTEIQPPQVTSNDEAADPSAQNADNPLLVREDVKNTSDSSGLHADDEARGEVIKDQLKRGLREIQPLD
jgi:hypothetical protein